MIDQAKEMPELPDAKVKRYVGLMKKEAETLANSLTLWAWHK